MPTVRSGVPPEAYIRRRSSTLSQYSLNEASQDFREEIVDPGPDVRSAVTTWKSFLPIVFASIPPVAGLFFHNGTAFFSDLILLFLATVFLHWSVTAPWKWYQATQQVREGQETALEESLELQSGARSPDSGSDSMSPKSVTGSGDDKKMKARKIDAALGRLHRLEIMALGACFLSPAAATYMLYSLRFFLSRPSEGLVSNFNVGIFFLAAEITPLSHAIKLVLAHTLHLQRIVNSNPYRTVRVTPSKYRELNSQLENLEIRLDEQARRKPCEGCDCTNGAKQQQAARQMREETTKEVRAAVAPDIDAIVRAVRRYERKTSTLTSDTEQSILDLRRRLDDVIALSAVVARNDAQRRGVMGNAADVFWMVVMFPLTAILWVISIFFPRPLGLVVEAEERTPVGVDEHGGIADDGSSIDWSGGGRTYRLSSSFNPLGQTQTRPFRSGRSSPISSVGPFSRPSRFRTS
ncbi:uncharacterized protein C8A04DRAFT_35058 [Dichotomopilus funicola]|uniref:Uncharacterized protein n=1 Tax=Dichotomopilus funicola TaxID=1934379 RepID=A0AAN6ZNZ3_9PEZI|nr:hypothetical protein C8A04DRAFT_35058 [Dichotomopilus funicola]